MAGNGNRLQQNFLKEPQQQQYSPNNSTLHITDDLRPPNPRVGRNRTEAQGGTDSSVVKADEGKQKQHAECVDNTAATQLSKLSDINLSCAPEQDLGLKSLNPVELRQKSRHPPLYTTGRSSESVRFDGLVLSILSVIFFLTSELMPLSLSSTVWPRQFLANRAGT